ncbi:restriction endonuclease subunit S [Pseudomonas syringae pv. syringae]|uniref:restriction endonuclease subunit S n=1 Tax=Pseudomonas syringae TaxID=317 RepID=UPI001F0EDB21|nr:restriction endonuclease subunit S [Pseudomonas syringae]MCH5551829.1 restriction endonuclease subunit S [Pseudomonas syringae pv. syringae]
MRKREINKVPQIRFKGFDEEWQLKSLSDLIFLENGYAFKSINFSSKATNIIVLTPGNVKIGGGFQHGKGQFYLENQYIPDKFIFNAGDIFVTMTDLTPTSQALGFPAIVPKDNNLYLHNQRLGKLTGYRGHEGFLFYLLSAPKGQKEVISTASGTTVKHTSPSKFLNRKFYFPIKGEQAKVGALFQELDQLIEQHQHKHDKLVALKFAMLQKMFPQPGATIPEIRFSGFEGKWVVSKLGNLGDFNPQATIPDVFEYVDLESVIGIRMVSHRTLLKSTAPSRAKRVAKTGDLFFQTVRPYQKNNYLFTLPDEDYVFSTGYAQIRPFNDGAFVLALVQRDNFVKTVMDNCTGTSYPAINSTVLSQLPVCFPSSDEEQQKIGTYFRQLDELISRHATQLEKLKQVKAAWLEKMFV